MDGAINGYSNFSIFTFHENQKSNQISDEEENEQSNKWINHNSNYIFFYSLLTSSLSLWWWWCSCWWLLWSSLILLLLLLLSTLSSLSAAAAAMSTTTVVSLQMIVVISLFGHILFIDFVTFAIVGPPIDTASHHIHTVSQVANWLVSSLFALTVVVFTCAKPLKLNVTHTAHDTGNFQIYYCLIESNNNNNNDSNKHQINNNCVMQIRYGYDCAKHLKVH